MTRRAASDHHLDVDALGIPIRIDVGGLPPVDRDLLADAWSGARATSGEAPVAVIDPRPHFRFDETVADLTTQVTLAALTARRGQLWMVHAGAVADEHGRVVMFSGRSGMGKTTLMLRLAREFAYVSDESVGVGADGAVLPYRKPLSVIADTARAKRQLSPRSLGLRELPAVPLRLHAIVVLDRDDTASPRLDELDIAGALDAIAPQCSYLAELDAPLQTLVGHVDAVGGALRLRYREADDALALVRALFDTPRDAISPSVAPEPWREPLGTTGFSRTRILDAVTINGDRLALLRRGSHDETTVHLIDGIGPALWRAADGISFDALVEAAVRAHGTPREGDPREVVRAAARALVAAGLIAWSPDGGMTGEVDDFTW